MPFLLYLCSLNCARVPISGAIKQETYAKRNEEILDAFCHGSHGLR